MVLQLTPVIKGILSFIKIRLTSDELGRLLSYILKDLPQEFFEQIAAVKFGSPHAFLPLQSVILPTGAIFLLQILALDVNLYSRV